MHPMTTMTMPRTVERTQAKPAEQAEQAQAKWERPVSQIMPFLTAMALLLAAGVASLLISGPMH
jgi:hypothetical protein